MHTLLCMSDSRTIDGAVGDFRGSAWGQGADRAKNCNGWCYCNAKIYLFDTVTTVCDCLIVGCLHRYDQNMLGLGDARSAPFPTRVTHVRGRRRLPRRWSRLQQCCCWLWKIWESNLLLPIGWIFFFVRNRSPTLPRVTWAGPGRRYIVNRFNIGADGRPVSNFTPFLIDWAWNDALSLQSIDQFGECLSLVSMYSICSRTAFIPLYH